MPRKPEKSEYPEWYTGYIESVPEGDVVEFMELQLAEMNELAAHITEEKSMFRYAEGKWSIKEIIGHLNDAERLLSARALCYIRNDKTDTPLYEPDDYIITGNFDSVPFETLVDEFSNIRKSTLPLFKRVNGEQWGQTGTAHGKSFTVRSMAYIIPIGDLSLSCSQPL